MLVYENTIKLSLSYNKGCVFDVNMEFLKRVYTLNETLHIQCYVEKNNRNIIVP